MASTLTTAKVASTVQAKASHQHVLAVRGVYSLAAALVLNDVIQMVKVPKGAQILEMLLTTDDMDTSTGIVLSVGDGGSTERFIYRQSTAQAGGIVRLGAGVAAANLSAAIGYQYTVEDTIDVLVQTAPSGTAATTGDISLVVLYHLDA